MSAGAEHGKGNSYRPRFRVVNSNAHRGWRKRTEGDKLGGLWQISGEHSAFVSGRQLLGCV